jgi:hypothetical protein
LFTTHILDAIDHDLDIRDPGIPWMTDALDVQQAQCQLNAALHSAGGGEIGELLQADLRRHKPTRRCLIEYQWSNHAEGADSRTSVFGKIRARGLDQTAYGFQKMLFANHREELARAGVVIAEPVAEVPLWRMWLQKKCNGHLPWETFDGPHGIDLARQVSRGIAAYHQLPIKLDRIHTVDHEWTILHERLSLLQHNKEYGTAVKEIDARCRSIAAELERTTRHLIHRDFYPDQVLINEPSLVLLDLDLSSMGDGQLDVGNFIAHLMEWSLRRGKTASALQGVCDAMSHAYCEAIKEASPDTITSYVLLSLARHIELSTRLPGRAHTIRPLIDHLLS